MPLSTHQFVPMSGILGQVTADADAVARTDSKVLITGESGVGKEVLARYIHEQSLRSHKRLVTINCAGVPETLLESELFGHVRGSFTGAFRDRAGLLEAAHGGTVLLDEIGEMSMRMQTLLLRFLETGEVQRVGAEHSERRLDVRLIAATNRDLLEDTKRRVFREDLYYRINVVHLVIPPLRERREHIAPLLDYYLRFASENAGIPPCSMMPDAMAQLCAYRWPGNIRELRNVAERIALRHGGRDVGAADLPREVLGTHVPRQVASVGPDGCSAVAAEYYERMTQRGESFWTVVYEPFAHHDLTREIVRTVIRRGLEEARGNYGILTKLFNLPPSDYKRFLRFLQKHDCHMPFKGYRVRPLRRVDRHMAAAS
jgi:transcriptional regulator with GAF, ATPase, and Fis domain